MPKPGTYNVVFNTDKKEFGGEDLVKFKSYKAENKPMHGLDYSIELDLAPLSAIYLEHSSPIVKKAKKKKALAKV